MVIAGMKPGMLSLSIGELRRHFLPRHVPAKL